MAFNRLLAAMRHIQRVPEVLRCVRGSAQWWKLTSCYVGLASFQPFDTVLRDGNRFRFEEYYDLETLWQIYFHSVYGLEPSDRVIVDAGANIGLFACFAAACLPNSHIVSIEPFPPTFERLKRHVQANGLTSRIECLQLALAGAPGSVSMAAEGGASQMVHVVAPAQAVAYAGVSAGGLTQTRTVRKDVVDVEAVTLGHLLHDLVGSPVDLLKIDIEGSEYEAVLAATPEDLAQVKRINLEYHARTGYTKIDLIEHLARSGFRVTSDGGSGEYGILHLRRN